MRCILFTVFLALFLNGCGGSPDGKDLTYLGHSCGVDLGLPCKGDTFCKSPDSLCPGGSVSGECFEIPDVCSELYKPVCGCDGKIYSNECIANMNGISITSEKTYCFGLLKSQF